MDNLTVVIPYYQGGQYIGRLLQSLSPDLPVIIVDDQSDSPLNCTLPNARVYRPDHKLYFTGAVNYGIERCSTDVLVLNQDAWLEGDGWQTLLVANRHEYALIGHRIAGSHPAFPNGYVQGTFQFMRRDAIENAGLMDAEHYPLWGASALWQWQICRKGFKSLPVADIPGFHHEERKKGHPHGESIMQLLARQPEDKAKFIRTPPAVSVVVPCYNHADFLPDLIASLIGGKTSIGYMPGQTFASFEVIVVDDGSTDNTPAVANSLANDWQGIRVIHQANQGTGAAINTGIRAAYGKYICVTGADDMREPWSLYDLYHACEANPHSFAYDNPTIVTGGKRGQEMRLGNYDFDALLTKNMVHAGIMVPKAAWVEVGGYPTSGVIRHGREDWAFNIALGLKNWCGVKVQRGGYLYRRHNNNRTSRNTDPDWRQRFLAQMAELYPDAYFRGKRPDMPGCCGGGGVTKRKPTPAQVAQAARIAMDVQSMTLIEYVGKNYGSQRWGGPGGAPSGKTYVFGRSERDRIRYVDSRDVKWLLGVQVEGQPVFRMHKPVVANVKEIFDTGGETLEAEITVEGTEPGDEIDVELGPDEIEVEVETEIPDPSEMTIAEIKELNLAPELWKLVLEEEKNGKNRAGAIEFIETKILYGQAV
jgi:glycosyltransferase involved in cell wall biosynthesis